MAHTGPLLSIDLQGVTSVACNMARVIVYISAGEVRGHCEHFTGRSLCTIQEDPSWREGLYYVQYVTEVLYYSVQFCTVINIRSENNGTFLQSG